MIITNYGIMCSQIKKFILRGWLGSKEISFEDINFFGDGSLNLVAGGYNGKVFNRNGEILIDGGSSLNDGNFHGNYQLRTNIISAPSLIVPMSFDNTVSNPIVRGVNSGLNVISFNHNVPKDKSCLFCFHANSYTTSVLIGDLRLNFSGVLKTLEESVNENLIEPMVLLNGHQPVGSQYNWRNFLNLYNGGSTSSANYPMGYIVFINKTDTLSGFEFKTNRNWNRSYADGVSFQYCDTKDGLSLFPPFNELIDHPLSIILNNENFDFSKVEIDFRDICFTDEKLNQLDFEKLSYSNDGISGGGELPLNPMLYEYGDKFLDLTGGWGFNVHTNTSGVSFIEKTDHMYLRLPQWSDCDLSTVNQIDCTGYEYINIEYEMVNEGYYANFVLKKPTVKEGFLNGIFVTGHKANYPTIASLPIEKNYIGEIYFYVSNTHGGHLKVKKIWLSKIPLEETGKGNEAKINIKIPVIYPKKDMNKNIYLWYGNKKALDTSIENWGYNSNLKIEGIIKK